jgi:protein-S-isoprenylcysteine O-methyltransferase Ste14
VPAKFWIAISVEFVVFAALLFGAAGTVRWLAAWVLLVLFFGAAILLSALIERHDPDLLAERLKSPMQKGQPLWDKIFLILITVLWFAWLALMGFDAVRFHWSAMPVWFQGIGVVGIAVSFWMTYVVLRENTFTAAVVRIQKERGQRVVSSGPYALVRHPLYASVLIMIPSIALLLGSWYGVAFSAILLFGILFRTVMEDRELQRGLEGYKEYAAKVPYRLVPHVW